MSGLAALRTQVDRHPGPADALLAAAVLLVSALPLRAQPGCGCPPVSGWAYVLVAGMCLPLAWRRRSPFGTALAVGVLSVTISLLAVPEPVLPFAALIAVYTVAAHAGRRLALTAAGVTAAALTIVVLVEPGADPGSVTVQYLVFAAAWLLGDSARSRRDRAVEMEARAAQLHATRAAEAQRAVAEERNRIARELHDHVAHHISLMVVQAEAGPVALRQGPGPAVRGFDSISATGRQALVEMRQLLGVLRAGDTGPLAPQPGLDRLEELAGQVRRAGLPVELAVEGTGAPLPAAVDACAYRILQEALTNALRHAGPARATVAVVRVPDELRLTVTDDGRGCAGAPPDSGNGLVGMRERAALVGGRLAAGPRPGGGWTVTAVLPLSLPA